MRTAWIAGLATLAMSVPGAAQEIYKCIEDGRVNYTSSPCADDAAPLHLGPNAEQATGAREAAMQRELERLRADLTRMQQEQRTITEAAPAPATGRSRADLQAEMARSPACREATRSYQLSANSANQRDVGMRRQAMRAACGMFEPERGPTTNVIVR